MRSDETETWQGEGRGTDPPRDCFLHHQLWPQNPAMERWFVLIPMDRWVKTQTSPLHFSSRGLSPPLCTLMSLFCSWPWDKPAAAFPTSQLSAVGRWLWGWDCCFCFANRTMLFPSGPGEAAASAGYCRPAGVPGTPRHPDELHPKGSLHPRLLWALSTALCCHPSLAHSFIFLGDFCLHNQITLYLVRVPGSWHHRHQALSSPLGQQLPIAVGPSHPK